MRIVVDRRVLNKQLLKMGSTTFIDKAMLNKVARDVKDANGDSVEFMCKMEDNNRPLFILMISVAKSLNDIPNLKATEENGNLILTPQGETK